MILSSDTIRQYIEDGRISIQPHFDEKQLRPFGLRVHLSDSVLIPAPNQVIDLRKKAQREPDFKRVDINASGLFMKPRDFVLGSTVEALRIDPTLTCRLDGRSTLARLGLIIHCTAEIIDSIHRDYRTVVLEMANIGPFELIIPHRYGIGMIVFETVSSPVDIAKEQSQYEGQNTVTPPNLNFDTAEYL